MMRRRPVSLERSLTAPQSPDAPDVSRYAGLRSRLLRRAILVLVPVLALLMYISWTQYVSARDAVRAGVLDLVSELGRQQTRQIALVDPRLPEDSRISLIDGTGVVRLRAPETEQWVGRSLRDTPLARVLDSGAAAVFDAPGLDGRQRVHGVVPVVWGEDAGARLLVSIPADSAYASLDRFLAAGIGSYVLLALVIAATWQWLDRQILSPLQELGAVVQQIANGERNLRAKPRREDEIGGLASNFNRMLDGLVASQKALIESERRWVLALEGAGLGVWDWNAQTNEVFFSRHWKEMLGYARKDVGHTLQQWFKLIHPDDLAQCQANRERHFRGETAIYRNEHRVRAKDGSWRWILDQGTVFERSANGEPLRVVGTYTDVTERKEAEQSLLEKQSALSEAQRIAHLGSWSWQLSTGAISCSDETLRLCGVAADEPVPDRDRLLALVHPQDRAAVEAWAAKCVAGGAIPDREFRVLLPDGQTRVLHGRGYLQRNARGEPMAMVGTVQDITERKALEQELHQHRNDLESLVQSRTSELETARAQAERLARVKSEFLANMSHEIRTPLNAVLGLARIGVRDSAGRQAHGTFVRIREAGEHLLGVINDVLDFSKLEAGRVVVDKLPLALAAVVDNVHSLIGERAQGKGLKFRVQMAPDLPQWVLGDEQRLRQILVNLLANAVKFTDRGEACLCVTRNGDDTFFEVSDTGIGMTDEQVSRLFRSFEQADNSMTRRYGGSGLGLAISQTLANQMGGQIVVTSTSGAGSTFTLRVPLPATAPPLPKPDPALPAHERRLDGLRLLAAEDVEVNRLVLEDLLVGEGAQVQFAEHGQQVLECLQERGAQAFDAVLMDIQMPVMDGYQATQALLKRAPGLPVIGLTAHAIGEERDRCLAAGMVEHVTKPIDPDVLVSAILRNTQRPVALGTPRVTELKAGGPVDWPAMLARYNGRQDFVTKLAKTALASHGDTPNVLRRAVRGEDFAGLAFTAHALKGLSGNLMARGVEALAREVEAAARANEPRALEAAGLLAAQVEAMLAALLIRTGEAAPSAGTSATA